MTSDSHPAARASGPAAAAVGADLATSKLLFFTAALLSLGASVYLFFSGQREAGIFVGLWVPSVLSAGALALAGVRHE